MTGVTVANASLFIDDLASALPPGMKFVRIGIDGTGVIRTRITVPLPANSAARLFDVVAAEAFRMRSATTISIGSPLSQDNSRFFIVGVDAHETRDAIEANFADNGILVLLAARGLQPYLLVDGGLLRKLSGNQRCPYCGVHRIMVENPATSKSPRPMNERDLCGGIPLRYIVCGVLHTLCTIALRIIKTFTEDEVALLAVAWKRLLGTELDFSRKKSRDAREAPLSISDLTRIMGSDGNWKAFLAHVPEKWHFSFAVVRCLRFARPVPPAALNEATYLLHREFSRNGFGDKWSIGCHLLVHTLDFISSVAPNANIEFASEQAVERMNQRLKRALWTHRGDLASAVRRINATSLSTNAALPALMS